MRPDDIELRHVVEHGGHREPLRELGGPDELRELVRQDAELRRHEVELRASRKRPEDIVDGKVEVQRRVPGHPVRRRRPEVAARPFDEVRHARVGDDDPFGGARRPGGEENMRGVVPTIEVIQRRRRAGVEVSERELGVKARPFDPLAGQPSDHDRRSEAVGFEQLVQQRAGAAAGEDPSVLAGLQDLRASLRRARRIDGDIDAIRLINAEDRDDRLERLGREEADPVPSPAPGLFEEPRQLVRSAVESAIAQALPVQNDGDGVRTPLGLARHVFLEPLYHCPTFRACRKPRLVWPSSSRSDGTSRMKRV